MGEKAPTDVQSLYENAVKYLYLVPLAGKCAHKLLKHPKDAKKCFEAAQALVKGLRERFGKAADKDILPEVFLKKVQSAMAGKSG
eukprot:2934459-Amphidinium_carterae.1